MNRIFLVGTPRSGTTLLQSFFAAHPSVFTLPETSFFHELRRVGRLPRLLGLGRWSALSQAAPALAHAVEGAVDVAWPELERAGLGKAATITQRFVHLLDECASSQGRTAWLEKTPRHLHHVRFIRRMVPDARVVFLLRDGHAVARSMSRVSTQSPEEWGGARSELDSAERWAKDVRIAGSHRSQGGNCFVRFEDLVESPEAILRELCTFARLDYSHDMLRLREASLERVLLNDVPWNESVQAGIRPRAETGMTEHASGDAVADVVAQEDISWVRGVVVT